jgi:hypothetical protein
VGSNLLLPQLSLFGIKGEFLWLFHSWPGVKLGLDGEVNLLVKKVSYFDTASKAANQTTGFNPFVLHPKLGLTGSFANNLVILSAYYNLFSVLNQNESFADFFQTGSKSTFLYPEVDAAVIVGVGNGGDQQIKFEIDMIVNNGDVKQLTLSTDKVIPYIKIGFVTNL